ncbi:hypothetical protein A2U01_0061608, partial [Trifolium medium]|nr:hypothetical protein [Trifolium medium]
CNGERSVQNKSSYPPRYRGANVTTTIHMEFTSTSRHLNPMYGLQAVMPMVHPMIQPMHVQPIYPMYGLQPGISVGQTSTSCYGLLQQVMKSANND